MRKILFISLLLFSVSLFGASTNIAVSLKWKPIVVPCVMTTYDTSLSAYTNTPTNAIVRLTSFICYEVWSTTNLSKPMTLLAKVGAATNALFNDHIKTPQKFFGVQGLYWMGTNYTNIKVKYSWVSDPKITNYRVHYGVASRVYTNVISVGTNTTVTVSNLQSGNTYYFSNTSVDTNGVESGYGSEISSTTLTANMKTNRVSVPCSIVVTR